MVCTGSVRWSSRLMDPRSPDWAVHRAQGLLLTLDCGVDSGRGRGTARGRLKRRTVSAAVYGEVLRIGFRSRRRQPCERRTWRNANVFVADLIMSHDQTSVPLCCRSHESRESLSDIALMHPG